MWFGERCFTIAKSEIFTICFVEEVFFIFYVAFNHLGVSQVESH